MNKLGVRLSPGAAEVATVRRIRPRWFCNQAPTATAVSPSTQFVPTFGRPMVAQVPPQLKSLLGADAIDRSPNTLRQLVDAWRDVTESAPVTTTLVSPSVFLQDTIGDKGRLHMFLTLLRHYDIPVHALALRTECNRLPGRTLSRHVDGIVTCVDRVHQRYRLPIWVTGMGVWDGTQTENMQLLRLLSARLEACQHVHRYAWSAEAQRSLVDTRGQATCMGLSFMELSSAGLIPPHNPDFS
jgi:hypothetical protein